MKNITDVPTLVKNYENAQKMIGADKIPVPGKHTTPEQWNEVFKKLGVPDKVEDYQYQLDPKTKVDDEFLAEFNKAALGAQILPQQAGKIVDFFADLNDRVWADVKREKESAQREKLTELKSEWGKAYESEIIKAKSAVLEFADEKEQKYFQESGLGKDPMFIRMMAKVGQTLAEDKIRGSGSDSPGALTPAQALAKIDEVKLNPKHAYWDAQNPSHLSAKKEYTKWFQMAYPEQSP